MKEEVKQSKIKTSKKDMYELTTMNKEEKAFLIKAKPSTNYKQAEQQ